MHRIDEFLLQSVVEVEAPFMAPEAFLPDATAEVLAAQARWLKPRYQDPVSGQLIFCFQSFLLRTPRHTILIDSCIGNHKERPNRPLFHRREGRFLEDLAALGVAPEAIDFVLCTHLHADHIGWNTRLVDGRWTPTFPNARYVMARHEYAFWEARHAADPGNPRSLAFADSVLPVVEAGRAVFVDHDHQIEDGVWLEPAPGHTPGNVVVNLRSGAQRAVLLGDAIHHPIQLKRPDWSCMACEDPALSAATRRALIERHADSDVLMVPAHFAAPSACHFVREGETFGFRQAGG